MAYWQVEIDPKPGRPMFGSCRVITYHSALGRHTALIECSHGDVMGLVGQPGIVSVESAQDGGYVDDSGATYEVSGGGYQCTRR